MERVIKFLFYVWILTLLVFSGLICYGLFFHPEWEELATNFMLGDVVIGIIAFLGFWGLGVIALFFKKHRQPAVNILGRSILITFAWGVLLALLVFSQVDNNPPVIAKGPMSEANQVVVSPSPTPSPTPIPKPIDPYANDPDLKDAEWGEAVKTETGSYRMKIQEDSVMSTAAELYQALNSYRNVKGRSSLAWDDKLAGYAQERAQYICANGRDGHAGFSEFLNNGGHDKLGFNGLGENMGNYKLSGTHLIEWMYAQSPGHDANQLNSSWSHVGIGISDRCSVLIFGGGKM